MSLTEEARKILSAPIPRHEIKTKVIQGSTIRFTSVQFVERRLEEADPNYEKVITLGPGGLVVSLTVCGVTRSAAADVPKEIKGFGSPVKNAEAQALKRAAARYGVAAELWDREGGEDEDDDDRPARKSASYGSSSSSSKYSGGSKGGSSKGGGGGDGPSAGQIKYLSEVFSVPSSVSKRLTPGREGTASALIDALRALKRDNDDDYEDNPKKFIKQALKKVAPTLVAKLAEAEEEEESDEDEDDED